MASLSRREIEHGLPWSWTPTRIKRFLALSSSNAYVVDIDGQFAGFSISSLGDARAHLVLLAVEPKWRKQGIGKILLDWQVQAARTAGLTDMSLEVRSMNKVAQLFYAAAGFSRIRSLPKYYCGIEDAVRFRMQPIRESQWAIRSNSSKSASQSKKFS